MDYSIDLKRRWRYRHPTKGMREVEPGIYDVPEQLSNDAARLAIAQGVAHKRADQRLMAVIAPGEAVEIARPKSRAKEKPKRGRRGGRRSNGRSPEDQSLGGAPENKSTLV